MPLRRRSVGEVVYYASPLLEAAGVRHAFSTRVGGVSGPPFDTLNLGNPLGCPVRDDEANLVENYARLMRAIGCAGLPRHRLNQVHGPSVAVVGPGPFASGQAGDALVTVQPGQVLTMRVADCCPVLLATPDGRAVAAAHAGWRGVVAGVVPATVATLCDAARIAPSELIAAVGPCIGFDAFEVGPDVLDAFDGSFDGHPSIARRSAGGKGHVDLAAACRRQLLDAGLAVDHIDANDQCTFSNVTDFYSHRRDHGVTGRMAALIATA